MLQQINLFSSLPKLPWYHLSERLLLQIVGGFIVILLLITGVQIAYLRTEKNNFAQLQKSYQASQQTFTTSTRLINQVNIELISREIEEKTLLLQTLQDRKVTSGQCALLSHYFSSLSEMSVPGLWFNQISVNLSINEIGLSGMTHAPILLIELVQNLNKAPCFANRDFGPLKFSKGNTEEGKAENNLLRFAITSKEGGHST